MAERREIVRNFRWSLRVNASSTWRDRVGDVLRRMADLVDGRQSAALAIATDPVLSAAQRQRAVHSAWDCLERSLQIETRAEAEEEVFRKLHPALFKVTHGQEQ